MPPDQAPLAYPSHFRLPFVWLLFILSTIVVWAVNQAMAGSDLLVHEIWLALLAFTLLLLNSTAQSHTQTLNSLFPFVLLLMVEAIFNQVPVLALFGIGSYLPPFYLACFGMSLLFIGVTEGRGLIVPGYVSVLLGLVYSALLLLRLPWVDRPVHHLALAFLLIGISGAIQSRFPSQPPSKTTL